MNDHDVFMKAIAVENAEDFDGGFWETVEAFRPELVGAMMVLQNASSFFWEDPDIGDAFVRGASAINMLLVGDSDVMPDDVAADVERLAGEAIEKLAGVLASLGVKIREATPDESEYLAEEHKDRQAAAMSGRALRNLGSMITPN